MADNNESQKERIKIIKSSHFIGIILAGITLCILLAAIVYFFVKHDTKEDSSDPKNAPAAARSFMNDTTIDEDGNIVLGKTVLEYWEELKKNGNNILKYLDSPDELAKLLNASMALDYPDTRENPDEPIDWTELTVDSTRIQGIVKFKRALQDGNTITMKYIPPTKFRELIDKYNARRPEMKMINKRLLNTLLLKKHIV